MSTGPTDAAGAAAPDSPTGTTGAGASDAGNVTAAVTADTETDPQAPPIFLPPKFERMPAELKKLKNWVLWVPIWNGSKWTKRPIQISGFGASSTKPKHSSSFDDVKQAYENAIQRGYIKIHEKDKPPQHVSIGGVGFVFDGQPDGDGLVFAGIDFDKVITGKVIASLAKERISRFGSYTEQSVSGRGFHVIVKARPLQSGVAHDGVELYTSGRFFTMSGGAPENARIAAGPDQFAALAEELRTQSTNTRSAKGDPSPGGEQTANAESDAWLGKLPPEKQTEVVKYAALHIATNCKLFELSGHGGNYQEYLKLTFAIARSGVAGAEDIFVEAASSAKNADSDGKLREFFQSCQRAQSSNDCVTVGTLFFVASQCGADFSEWSQIADGYGPDVALYVPGNEDECRRRLDRIVAADPRTFTLGDPSGPLVILRAPEKEALPSNTRWEGDLPGTTLAKPADIMQRAEQLVWKQRAGGKGSAGRLSHTHPPRPFVAEYLTQMRGQFGARALRGIVRVPRIADSGEIHFISGYDPQTGLFHDRSPVFDVPPKPSRDDARKMADTLLLPFSKYQFDDPAAGRALILAAIFTAIERPFSPVAPMFIVRSPMPATGKGKIVRGLVSLAFDTAPVVITWGGSSEEFEKRLAALLLQAPAALMIDNANGMHIQGDLLESILTEGCADIRLLGHSEIVKVRNRSFTTLTGNNPNITGDMARRALPMDIRPASADPERVRYGFDPVEVIQRNRSQLLQAAFIVMRAFRLAGMPRQGLPAVGSFDDWSRRVRDLVYWLTSCDVSEGFRRNKAEDPRRQADGSLLAALHQHFGTKPFKAADVIAVHEKVGERYSSWTASEQALHDALNEVLGSREVNARKFGQCARRLNGPHNSGFVLEAKHDPATNANVITVRKT
jgi:hypothetical protein